MTVAPGLFATPMMKGLPQEAQDSLGKQTPFPPRLGQPNEFVGLGAQILENVMLNGETIRLDGAGQNAASLNALAPLIRERLARKADNRLLFGPLAAVLLIVGIAVLPLWVPGYSQVHQTVSEIGEMDSPARIPFAIMLCGVAVCLRFSPGASAPNRKKRSRFSVRVLDCVHGRVGRGRWDFRLSPSAA